MVTGGIDLPKSKCLTIYNLPYDQAKRISDHYPLYATFHINNDID